MEDYVLLFSPREVRMTDNSGNLLVRNFNSTRRGDLQVATSGPAEGPLRGCAKGAKLSFQITRDPISALLPPAEK